jgi:integrase
MAATQHTIMGGKVHVYKRENSRFWQCSAYLAGKNRRATTKQESLSLAKEFAEDWYLNLRGKARSGEITNEKTFRDAAAQFEREYEIITEGERNPDYVEGHSTRLRLHLLPFFGDLPLSQITPAKVQDYRIHRLNPNGGEDAAAMSFKQAARQFERESGFRNKRRSAADIEACRERLRSYLLPYFGGMPVSEITPEAIEAYRIHRLNPDDGSAPPAASLVKKEIAALGEVLRWHERRSQPPARSTMHHEIVTLRQVLKTALRQGWLQHLPDLSTPYGASGKIRHRAWFSPEEYRQLYTATRKQARASKGMSWQWAAEQLHDYVLFMANTGLRPDEANNLEFRDVRIVEDDATGETILEIEVRGKRGVGYCMSTPGAVRPFERLSKRPRPVAGEDDGGDEERLPEPTDLVFPANHKKQFGRILEREDLKFDRDGNRRTAYSLRHTYICLRLLEGADIYQIAKNCRTSVEMIEKYYAAHIKTSIDIAAINVRRERPRPAKEQPRPSRRRIAEQNVAPD